MRLAVVVLLASAAIARTARGEPADLGHSLVLARGQLDAEVVIGAGIAPATLGEPLSLAPDAWWGATDRLTLGIVHADPALDRYDAGGSVCVRTLALVCEHAYHGGGLDARWRALADGGFEVAPRARLLVRDVEPWKPAITLGALARWTHGRVELTGDPYLQLGLANTDRGNRAQLVVPVAVSVGLARTWRLELATGYESELAVWRDGYHVPAYLEVQLAATAHVELAAAVGFTSAYGPQASGKERSAFLSVGWRS